MTLISVKTLLIPLTIWIVVGLIQLVWYNIKQFGCPIKFKALQISIPILFLLKLLVFMSQILLKRTYDAGNMLLLQVVNFQFKELHGYVKSLIAIEALQINSVLSSTDKSHKREAEVSTLRKQDLTKKYPVLF
jgi:hypothetical protein